MKFFQSILVVLALLISLTKQSLADNLTPPLLVKSKYFSILGSSDINIVKLLNDLKYDYFLQPDVLLKKGLDDPKTILGETADALLMECSRILGIHIYSFQATMELLSDQNTLKIVIKGMTGLDIEERAFYLDEQKTIFLSLDRVKAGVLGHEMAHALVCHYFGVPPAANIQEILAGYVDYSLSKTLSNVVIK